MHNSEIYKNFMELVFDKSATAYERYEDKYDKTIHDRIVKDCFAGNAKKGSYKLTHTCLALCGHYGYKVDLYFIQCLPDYAIEYLATFTER